MQSNHVLLISFGQQKSKPFGFKLLHLRAICSKIRTDFEGFSRAGKSLVKVHHSLKGSLAKLRGSRINLSSPNLVAIENGNAVKGIDISL